jgi:D-alanyl-D-alanine carboxypeptidase
MTTTAPRTKSIRTKLAAAAAVGALLTTAALASAGAAGASATPRHQNAALRAALHRDLTRYLTARRTAEHISADSLRVTFPGSRPPISLAAGTTRYHGGAPVSARALWQIGSNTKAFTAVIMLKLEAEGKLSISDPIGKWLPQYPAWRHITIRQLLDMTSRIPDYLYQPAFDTTFAADPATRFTAARLVSYVAGLPLGPAGWHYTNTDYILAQMIIEKVTHDTYADQLTRRILTPLRLHTTCLAPYTCPPSDAARMPAGYFFIAGGPPSLSGKAMPRLALTWAQAAGGIVSSLADMTTWNRALYQGGSCHPASSTSSSPWCPKPPASPSAAPPPPSQSATGSASSRYSIPRPASSGTTKARPSALGSCTSTFPAPACSSRSPPTAQPPTTTCPTCPERFTRPCKKQAQYPPAEPPRRGYRPRHGSWPVSKVSSGRTWGAEGPGVPVKVTTAKAA